MSHSLEQTKAGLRFKSPKTGRGRTVTLPAFATEELRSHKREQSAARLRLGPAYRNHDLVFPRPDGTPWPPSTFTTLFASRIRRSNLTHVRFHDLRHTHATQMLLEGVPAKVVSERLGHSSIAITLDTYSHVLPGMQEDAAARIDAALGAVLRNRREP